MKQLFILALGLVGVLAQANPGRYEGKGTIGIPGTEKKAYDVTINVIEIEAKKSFTVKETYQEKGKAAQAFESKYLFDANGTLRIERNGIKIGCGHCVAGPNGAQWCDYRVETDMGLLHVNMYSDMANKAVYRMGDIITLNGVLAWSDSATLVP